MADRFYVTTPIYYVNAVPHLGTLYSTVVADALARYHRARGHDTFLLTGTDEHGQKIERLARERNQPPQVYCQEVVAQFKTTWARFGIQYDRFIRTTDADHRSAVEEMWRRLEAAGDLYQADYDGMYCVGCEGWKTEEDIVAGEAGEKLCPLHNRPVERVKERNWFFRLSRYAERLLALYERPGFIRPESRRNEVAEFVKRGLRDLSVSRASVTWGIPVPGDPGQSIYVWLDALTNYLTALGGPKAVSSDERARALWAASHHIIGKDILRFHAVYWPAFLMAAELPPPAAIFCHGFLTVKGQKISKSMPATRVEPNAIADVLGPDPLRYFVLREYTFGADGDFTYEALLQRYESELGNDLGNLVNRTVSMARQLGPVLEALGPSYAAHDPLGEECLDLRRETLALQADAERAWDDFAPARALEATWAIIRRANVFIDRTAPWKLKKAGETAALRAVLAHTCEAIRRAGLMVAPAMPEAARQTLEQIGRGDDLGTWPAPEWAGWAGATLQEPAPIFPRLDPDRQAAVLDAWIGSTGGVPAAAATSPEITLDDFAKVDLRTARVVAAEKVANADKLLKLTLDLGGEQRTVVSGIATAYPADQLIGRTVVYLANLKPAKIRGVMSQGMILAAGDKDVLALCALDRDVPPGTKVR